MTTHYEAWLTTHPTHTNWCDVAVFWAPSDGVAQGEALFTAQTTVPTSQYQARRRGQETRAGRAIRAQQEAAELLRRNGWITGGPWTLTHLGYRINVYRAPEPEES